MWKVGHVEKGCIEEVKKVVDNQKVVRYGAHMRVAPIRGIMKRNEGRKEKNGENVGSSGQGEKEKERGKNGNEGVMVVGVIRKREGIERDRGEIGGEKGGGKGKEGVKEGVNGEKIGEESDKNKDERNIEKEKWKKYEKGCAEKKGEGNRNE